MKIFYYLGWTLWDHRTSLDLFIDRSSAWRLLEWVLNRKMKWGTVLDGRLYMNKHGQLRCELFCICIISSILYMTKEPYGIMLKIRRTFEHNPESERTFYILFSPWEIFRLMNQRNNGFGDDILVYSLTLSYWKY